VRAVVFNSDRAPEIATVPDPVAGRGEVLVRVEHCGICGSDLHAAHADLYVPGITMGHEFSGTIIDTGSDTRGWAAGDRVSVNPNSERCGRCEGCLSGRGNLCPRILETSVGARRHGGLSELVAVPASSLHRLPDEVDSLRGAWVEPLAVCMRILTSSQFRPGADAIVFGTGPIGLLLTTLLVDAGARDITVVEPNPTRRSLAESLGARAISPWGLGAPEAVLSNRPQFAFDCVGSTQVVQTALGALGPGGTLTLAGMPKAPLEFDGAQFIFRELTIRSSFIYNDEFDGAIEMLAHKRVDPAKFVSDVVPLERALDAFDQMRSSPDAVKVMVSC
jgi:2-desacetyl-2-hydroxyethyl bacteriochlorophyllide A dehydrogenase